jgi:hypothetical protein
MFFGSSIINNTGLEQDSKNPGKKFAVVTIFCTLKLLRVHRKELV